jgi:hypothetical protein
MLDFEVSKKEEQRDWDEVLPLGEKSLVSLNTMIPRELSKRLGEATGWLQIESPRLRYTKQATIQYLLERGLESFYEDIKKQYDEDTSETPSEVLADDSKVIDMIKSRKREINMKDYESFANKHSGGYRYNR